MSAQGLLPGISFVVRARNEEKTLAASLASLAGLTIPHEIIVILHLCTDGSKAIAERFQSARLFEYSHAVSRVGYETLVTPSEFRSSIVRFYNWCFEPARHLWCFKWDADFIASPELVTFLNGRAWEESAPARIRIPAVSPDGKRNVEPYLFNAGRRYAKYVFWEYNASLFAPGVREEVRAETIEHASSLDEASTKSYWRDPPWFASDEFADAAKLRDRYARLVEMFGPEPLGMARASNPACDAILRAVLGREPELRESGIELWN